MKTKAIKKRGRPRKTHPVPEWMDPKIAEHAKHMDVLKRISLADELEKAATELREFKQSEPAEDYFVRIRLFPTQVKAAIAYAARWGFDKNESEEDKVRIGATWILDSAFTMLPQILDRAEARVRYRNAEGLSNGALVDAQTKASLEKFEAMFVADDDEDDD